MINQSSNLIVEYILRLRLYLLVINFSSLLLGMNLMQIKSYHFINIDYS